MNEFENKPESTEMPPVHIERDEPVQAGGVSDTGAENTAPQGSPETATESVPENGCTYHGTGVGGTFASEPAQAAPQEPYRPESAQPQPNGWTEPAAQPVQNEQPTDGYAPNGYGTSGYGTNPGYGYPPRPKKRMALGTKIFLWVLGSCAVLSILAFMSYGFYSFFSGSDSSVLLPPTTSQPAPTASPSPSQAPDSGSSSQSEGVQPADPTPGDSIVIEQRPSGEMLSAAEVYESVVNSTVLVKVSFSDASGQQGEGTGSGVIISQDGYIITNSHVVQDSRNVTVKVVTYGGDEYDATVVGYDRTTDLAVIKADASGLSPARLGSAAQMKVGEEVIAIGNPGGEDFSFSMTGGYISGLDRHVGSYSSAGMTYIQTDAAINPGNSGGALVNLYGQVIGINSSKIVANEYESMGFAIPIDKAQTIINELMTGGYVTGRVRLGIRGYDVTDSQVYSYGVPYGFIVAEIDEDSSFAGTDVQPGDIITAIDGETVSNLNQISNKLLEYQPGDKVTLTMYRLTTTLAGNENNGKSFDVTITLLADNGETQN